jgi:hypothetical protein
LSVSEVGVVNKSAVIKFIFSAKISEEGIGSGICKQAVFSIYGASKSNETGGSTVLNSGLSEVDAWGIIAAG